MTEKRFMIAIDSNNSKSLWDNTKEEPLIALNRFDEIFGIEECCELLNALNNTNRRLNREIMACCGRLATIEDLCDAILNYDFKDVNSKVDFCHMLNEMDNKDLAFLKEAFTAIRDNDLKRMVSLTKECLIDDGGDV